MIKMVDHHNMLDWLVENHYVMSVYYDGVMIKRNQQGFTAEIEKPDLKKLFEDKCTEVVTLKNIGMI